MNATRLAKLSGNVVSFDVPEKLRPCQEFAADAMVSLYAAELRIISLRRALAEMRQTLELTQLDIADYQAAIVELDRIIAEHA